MNVVKSDNAFRTIGELSKELGVPQHVLRYWESRFPQLRPLTRAGNRRYYRPEDVALVKRINTALHSDGYTIKGVQRMLVSGDAAASSADHHAPVMTTTAPAAPTAAPDVLPALLRVRDLLRAALND